MQASSLSNEENLYYRDLLRAARYSALADSEGFGIVCFALEELGMRLSNKVEAMNEYERFIGKIAFESTTLSSPQISGAYFKSFKGLYEIIRRARNDAMHSGAYARHATEAAIELCIGLEEGLMANTNRTVANLMVKHPITVAHWQPVAQARHLMLMHSFSFLPVFTNNNWYLLSELGLAKFLAGPSSRKKELLGRSIKDAFEDLHLCAVPDESWLRPEMNVNEVLANADVQSSPTLWLVVDADRRESLVGVLSPFELM